MKERIITEDARVLVNAVSLDRNGLSFLYIINVEKAHTVSGEELTVNYPRAIERVNEVYAIGTYSTDLSGLTDVPVQVWYTGKMNVNHLGDNPEATEELAKELMKLCNDIGLFDELFYLESIKTSNYTDSVKGTGIDIYADSLFNGKTLAKNDKFIDRVDYIKEMLK